MVSTSELSMMVKVSCGAHNVAEKQSGISACVWGGICVKFVRDEVGVCAYVE
jgi:hypothetical protein